MEEEESWAGAGPDADEVEGNDAYVLPDGPLDGEGNPVPLDEIFPKE